MRHCVAMIISVISRRELKYSFHVMGFPCTRQEIWSVLPEDTPMNKPNGSTEAQTRIPGRKFLTLARSHAETRRPFPSSLVPVPTFYPVDWVWCKLRNRYRNAFSGMWDLDLWILKKMNSCMFPTTTSIKITLYLHISQFLTHGKKMEKVFSVIVFIFPHINLCPISSRARLNLE